MKNYIVKYTFKPYVIQTNTLSFVANERFEELLIVEYDENNTDLSLLKKVLAKRKIIYG